MDKVLEKITTFFKKDFKKKFILFFSVPLFASAIFLTDFFFLPEINQTDSISSIMAIKISQSEGGTSMRKRKVRGYRYTTKTNFKFSTLKKRKIESDVELTVTPLFKVVKSVTVDSKKVSLESGFNGLNKLLLICCNSIILLSIFYMILTKKISENARLNLIFLNAFILAVWLYALVLF